MKLTEVRIGLDSSKAMFYFTAEGRVTSAIWSKTSSSTSGPGWNSGR